MPPGLQNLVTELSMLGFPRPTFRLSRKAWAHWGEGLGKASDRACPACGDAANDSDAGRPEWVLIFKISM